MKKIVLQIEGMSCSACSNGLEKYLKKQKDIKSVNVNLVMATASIVCEDDVLLETLQKYVEEAGFKATDKIDVDSNKEKKMPLFVFGFLAVLLMYISMAHMVGLPSVSLEEDPKLYAMVLLILTIPFLVYGRDLLSSGIKNLVHGMPNMDTLVTLGVISSFSYSLFGVIMIFNNHFNYVHSLYFESVAFVIYFLKLGRLIDKKATGKAIQAIKSLVLVTPSYAIRENGEKVTIDEVKKGDILKCSLGEAFAVDGKIVEGTTYVNESFITGESIPVLKQFDDKVVAGSINEEFPVKYKAENIGKDSTISEIVKLVMEASGTKAPIAKIADKICGVFVPTIMIIAVLVMMISLILGVSFSSALVRFVSVLVVSCPCALGLATPLAMVVASGSAAKRGIILKNNEVLEVASKVDTVVFDKTGTLTKGELKVYKLYNFTTKNDDFLLQVLGGLEEHSIHPIAKCLTKYASDNTNEFKKMKIKEMPGFGVMGIVGKKKYYCGNFKLLDDLNINNEYEKEEDELRKNGCSVSYIIEDKKIIGLIGVSDTLRDDSKPVIQKLNKLGVNTIMLTGDNKVTAEIVASNLGIKEVMAEVLPKEKNAFVRNLKSSGHIVMMVGDGINDAPSLTTADIGVSLSDATDIAAHSASVVITNNKLNRIVDLILISKKTMVNIKENLFWAFIYNIMMIPLASGFLPLNINPMIASTMMVISSLFVVLNALRLKNIKFEK